MAEEKSPSSEELDAQVEEAEMIKKLNRFKDVDGVSMRGLSFGLWYLKHRRTFFLAIVWFLSILATVLWVFSIYYFAYYLLVGMKEDRVNNSTVTENPLAVEQRQLMSNIDYNFIQAVDLGRNSYSLVGEFTNANTSNWPVFVYYFLVDGEPLGTSTSYSLIEDKKYLTSVVDNLVTPPISVKMVVTNIRWSRIDRHSIADWQQFKTDHLDFVVLDKKFIGATQSILSDRLPVNSLSFNISNRTAYSYLEAPLQIILYSGSEVVYVKDYFLNNFYSKDKEDVNLAIIGNLPNINRIEIIPNINILSQANFLKN